MLRSVKIADPVQFRRTLQRLAVKKIASTIARRLAMEQFTFTMESAGYAAQGSGRNETQRAARNASDEIVPAVL